MRINVVEIPFQDLPSTELKLSITNRVMFMIKFDPKRLVFSGPSKFGFEKQDKFV